MPPRGPSHFQALRLRQSRLQGITITLGTEIIEDPLIFNCCEFSQAYFFSIKCETCSLYILPLHFVRLSSRMSQEYEILRNDEKTRENHRFDSVSKL
jgi:hypothetical protein